MVMDLALEWAREAKPVQVLALYKKVAVRIRRLKALGKPRKKAAAKPG